MPAAEHLRTHPCGFHDVYLVPSSLQHLCAEALTRGDKVHDTLQTVPPMKGRYSFHVSDFVVLAHTRLQDQAMVLPAIPGIVLDHIWPAYHPWRPKSASHGRFGWGTQGHRASFLSLMTWWYELVNISGWKYKVVASSYPSCKVTCAAMFEFLFRVTFVNPHRVTQHQPQLPPGT